ncbi:hypothetical protein CONPUDRAFT_81429 [Coniophora puteana RWD-64-598 SS2]|uniref:ARM repeat-containing protein n=1 Tax=Coniophora puteana (strain RWD-64-598) TaxID=741705 RepID=A0A5M3MWL2_CONPW|nr:uncharacterized protein CONPUDRAFT_81429 [Coniophora puteana RWD-64-598 SS2]EIW83538.1 hypothetical protein CONPUDRAFT_81429 [Coniophora puteana RWD-64-598 SS2]
MSAPEPRRCGILMGFFSKLMDPNEDPMITLQCIGGLSEEILKNRKALGQNTHLSSFALLCINAGVVPTMMDVSKHDWSGRRVPIERYSAQYWAMQCLCGLMLSGNSAERQHVLKEMLKEDIVDLCLQYMRHRLCIMHYLATNTLRTLADESLGLQISSDVAAEIIETICDHGLQGPETLIKQMLDPATSWQNTMFLRNPNVTTICITIFR